MDPVTLAIAKRYAQSDRLLSPYKARSYPAQTAGGSTATSWLTKHRLAAFPVWVGREGGTVDLLGVEVMTPQADTVLRIGLYHLGDSLPGPLLVDAGTVDTSTDGVKLLDLSPHVVVPDSVVWFAYAWQGEGSRPTLRAFAPALRLPHNGGSLWTFGSNIGPSTLFYSQDVVSGAFPQEAPNWGGYGGTSTRLAALVRFAT